MVPPRKLKPDRDTVPPMERVLDKQGSSKLLEMEMEEGVAGTDRPVPSPPAPRRPSAVAMAISEMGRRHSMIYV